MNSQRRIGKDLSIIVPSFELLGGGNRNHASVSRLVTRQTPTACSSQRSTSNGTESSTIFRNKALQFF